MRVDYYLQVSLLYERLPWCAFLTLLAAVDLNSKPLFAIRRESFLQGIYYVLLYSVGESPVAFLNAALK